MYVLSVLKSVKSVFREALISPVVAEQRPMEFPPLNKLVQSAMMASSDAPLAIKNGEVGGS